jgi:CBS domain-containing protein
MSPRTIGDLTMRTPTPLNVDLDVGGAVRAIVESGLPALPVVEDDGRLAGIFGEREFITALFPGYLNQLSSARFVKRSLDEQLDRRAACRSEPVRRHMTRDHVEVPEDFSDAQLAETFLHHRVLIIPIVSPDRRPVAVVTRSDFFRALVERFEARGALAR